MTTLTASAVHPARFYPIPCWCPCQLAHPAEPGVCEPDRPDTARPVAGGEVPVCVPCATALDRRPRSWA